MSDNVLNGSFKIVSVNEFWEDIDKPLEAEKIFYSRLESYLNQNYKEGYRLIDEKNHQGFMNQCGTAIVLIKDGESK